MFRIETPFVAENCHVRSQFINRPNGDGRIALYGSSLGTGLQLEVETG